MDASEADRASGSSETVWNAGRVATPPRPLTGSQTAEVCVIGAGIAGLTTALLLAKEGRDVVLLEDGTIGSGETGRTTAHLTAALDDRYEVLEKLHGADGAKLAPTIVPALFRRNACDPENPAGIGSSATTPPE